MDFFGSPRLRHARVDLRPDVEALEGRICLSATTLHSLAQHASAAELGTGGAGVHHGNGDHHHHSQPSVVLSASGGHQTLPGIHSMSAQATTATTLTGGNGYKYTRVGNAPLADPTMTGVSGGLALEGGGTDIDQVFTWMGDMAGTDSSGTGTHGDFLVIRATDDTGYNVYPPIHVETFNSVATLDIPNRSAAFDPAVANIINNADAIFIGGGNQANYLDYWEGTPVQTAIDKAIARKVPLGGTSAGTDVIGQFIFTAEHGTITSAQALNNPFDNRLTLDENFVSPDLVPLLKNTIVDTHFVTRDRMGRMVAFLARIDTNGWSPNNRPRGIGINEQTALLIHTDKTDPEYGVATVVSNAGIAGLGATNTNAYFLQTPGPAPTIAKGVPLTYSPLNVAEVSSDGSVPDGSFNLKTWEGISKTTSYTISATNGVLTSTSTTGSIYGV